MCEILKRRSGIKYYAIDPYRRGRLGINFCEVIAKREADRAGVTKSVQWLRLKGEDAPGVPDVAREPFDFVFIDGDHSFDGLRRDWEAWRPLIDFNGIVAFHDTRGGRFECEKYLREHIMTDRDFELVDEVDSLTVFRRTKQPSARRNVAVIIGLAITVAVLYASIIGSYALS